MDQKSEESAELKETVPVKTGEKSFLDYLKFELSNVGRSQAGEVTKGEVKGVFGPVQIGAGAGALELNYYRPLFFVTPSLEAGGKVGAFDLYGSVSMPIIPGTSEVRTSMFKNISAGGVWETMSDGGYGLRLGVEAGVWAQGGGVFSYESPHFTASGGAAFIFEPLIFYAKEQVFFGPDRPYEYAGAKASIPHHDEARAGVVIHLDRASIRVEMLHTPFKTGGEAAVSLEGKYVGPEIYVWGAKAQNEMFADEIGVGVKFRLGEKETGKVKIERGFAVGREKGGTRNDTAELTAHWTPALFLFTERMKSSETFGEFAKKYKGSSFFDLVAAAQALAWAGEKNYSGPLADAVNKPYSEDARTLEEIGVDNAYRGIREWILSRKTADAGICGNISSLATKFLQMNGAEAYTVELFRKDQGHSISIARDTKTNKMYLIDYDHMYEYNGEKIWPLLQMYAKERGTIIDGVRLYGKDNKVIGYYKGPEGELAEEMAGKQDGLKERLIKRPR